MSRQDIAILSAEALTQLTWSIVKEHCSAAQTYSTSGSSIQKIAKEPHPKIYHSVSTRKTLRQQETCNSRDVSTPTSRTDATPVDTSSCSGLLEVSVNIVSPSPQCLLSRSLSSSVDSSPALDSPLVSHHSDSQVELEEFAVVGTETNIVARPNTLSLDREMSTTSNGSGKTTPCNIPGLPSSERSSRIRSPVEEKLVSSYPPGPMPSCWMSPVRREAEDAMESRNGGRQQSLVRFIEGGGRGRAKVCVHALLLIRSCNLGQSLKYIYNYIYKKVGVVNRCI